MVFISDLSYIVIDTPLYFSAKEEFHINIAKLKKGTSSNIGSCRFYRLGTHQTGGSGRNITQYTLMARKKRKEYQIRFDFKKDKQQLGGIILALQPARESEHRVSIVAPAVIPDDSDFYLMFCGNEGLYSLLKQYNKSRTVWQILNPITAKNRTGIELKQGTTKEYLSVYEDTRLNPRDFSFQQPLLFCYLSLTNAAYIFHSNKNKAKNLNFSFDVSDTPKKTKKRLARIDLEISSTYRTS